MGAATSQNGLLFHPTKPSENSDWRTSTVDGNLSRGLLEVIFKFMLNKLVQDCIQHEI